MKNFKKITAFLMAMLLLVSMLAGCGEEEADRGEVVDFAVNEVGNTVEDSSELPDWKGRKLDLTMWYGQGTGAINKDKKASQDVVASEIYRVTGVKFSEEKSFDNNGELMDAKISKIIAAGEWPDIVVNPERAVLEKMIEADMVYDLTELIPQYCPNIQALIEQGGDTPFLQSERKDGKLYHISVGVSVEYMHPDIDPTLLARVKTPVDPNGFVYVRDDILKKIYPEAKTQKEIEKMYMEKGEFTKEDILDVCFNSPEEFYDFLYKVKALGVKEGNREVYPIYVADGIDNWSLFALLSGHLYGYNTKSVGSNYFTYWDQQSGKVEYMFKQPFFKDIVKQWTKLVQDDIANPDSLIDNRASFEEKLNNGQYAVLYGQAVPDQNVLNAGNKSFGYRKVYINVPMNTNKFLFAKKPESGTRYALIKSDNIKEEDLPQVLRFFDFMASKAGQKLAYWGPKSAGLFTEENGVRKFVDEKLEAEAVYDAPKDLMYKYNLNNSSWPGYPYTACLEQPKLVGDFKRQESTTNKFFSMGAVEVPELTTSTSPDIWSFDAYGVEKVTEFWAARQSFENALTKILIAENDAEFNKLYAEMIETAERNGLTNETLAEINEAFKELNADYMKNLKK